MPAPTVTSISPTSGVSGGGNTVIITGTGFLNTTSVTFGSTAASSFTVSSNTQIRAVVPPGPGGGGSVSVLVTTPFGTSASGVTYTYGTTPVVTSINPTGGSISGGNTVTITGSGFLNTTSVTFGSAAASSFTVVSSTQITAVVPPGPGGGGIVSVLVTTPFGTSGSGVTYTYGVAPVITNISPTSGPTSGGNTVIITGSSLTNTTAVTFGSTAATSFTAVSNTEVTAIVPPGPVGGGTVSVTVTTTGGTSGGIAYTYIGGPVATSVFPTAGVISGGETIIITGSQLSGTTSVSFGSTPATSFTVISDTELDVITPIHVAGTFPINITTPGGTNSSLSFVFQPPAVITSINPMFGPVMGGTVVTINGAGLINTLSVFFGTMAATAFTIDSDNVVTAIAPASVTEMIVTVIVNTASSTSNGVSFTYLTAPTLTGISPSSGPLIGNKNVTLTGTGFTQALDVIFGENPAVFTVISDTLISAIAPSGNGTVSVTLVTPGGTSGSLNYTYV